MDIRSIIDSDTSDSIPAKQFPSQRFDPKAGSQQPQPSLSYEAPTSAHKRPRSKRPPQPPPLQPPIQPMYNAIRSPGASSHNSVKSPYSQTPSSALSGGHYTYLPTISTQNPAHGFQLSPNSQRESHVISKSTNYQPYGQPTTTSQTPNITTPISYHQAYARQGSSHSLSNPSSAQNQSPSTFKESPQSSQGQIRTLSQSASSQQHPSQPGTPLGPPSMISRPSLTLSRESPGLYDHQRNSSAGTYVHQQFTASSPGIDSLEPSTTSPLASAAESFSHAQTYHKLERGRSLSVSPKTLSGELDLRRPGEDQIISSMDYSMQIGGDPMVSSTNQSFCTNGYTTSTKRETDEDPSEVHSSQEQTAIHSPTRSRSLGMKGILNSPRVNEAASFEQESLRTKKRTFSVSDNELVDTPATSESQASHSFLPSSTGIRSEKSLSHDTSLHQQSSLPRTTPDSPIKQQTTPVMSSTPLSSPAKTNSASPPPAVVTVQGNSNKRGSDEVISLDDPPIEAPRKRRRFEQPPIYAQSCRKGQLPHASNKKLAVNRTTLARQDSATVRPSSAPSPQQLIPSTAKQPKQGMNDHTNLSSETTISKPHLKLTEYGPLGDWEENILNTRPSEEAIKAISDFLYTEVVGRLDVGAGPAGGGSSKGAMMEIEAKIGQLIDKNTNERLRLPVSTECVLHRDDPSLRVNFKSSMTEVNPVRLFDQSFTKAFVQAQHRSLNGFLNQAFVKSLSRPRVPMSYVHTYECDTFHELSQTGIFGLPASIRSLLNPRHSQVKVRITTDQKTGRELAKIVKVRIADLDVYSPRTAFDWRVSVNLEMNFDGEMKDLLEPQARNGRRAERNKDRMSYKHLAYQIDLTQVTTAEVRSNSRSSIVRTRGTNLNVVC